MFDHNQRLPTRTAAVAIVATCAACFGYAADEGRRHWSFVPPVRPTMPTVKDREWGGNAIDRFILARLARQELQSSSRADRRTLIRRVTFDLTGLPPTIEQIDAFLADKSPDAYDKVVRRLLTSPHYGERMALRWLDLARYADTNGYSIDGGRHMWAWRDWVIDAYNRNMPFDRFTVEQLAGDLLPAATTSQRIASGFNRNHMNTHEGGTIEEEYRVAYVVDRVNTTAQTWLGLTVGCAQCHDHKYDPISQREYYSFFAYFNTITDRGNDGNGGVNSVPFMPVFSPEQEKELADLNQQRGRLREKLLAADPQLDAAQDAWAIAERSADRSPPSLGPWHLLGPLGAKSGDEAFKTAYGPESEIDLETSYLDGALRWQERPELQDGKAHPLVGEKSAWYLHRTLTANRADAIELSFGSDDSIKVWFNGCPVLDSNAKRGVAPDQERITVDMKAGENELLIKIVNYGGPGGFYFKLLRSGPPVEIVDLLGKDSAAWSDEQRRAVGVYYRSIAPELQPLRTEIAEYEERIAAINAKPKTTAMVMQEMQKPRDTFVLDRGRYDLPGEKVTVGTPSCLPPLPQAAPPSRLGLARWLVDPAHPLTARVAVNGYWQMLFGAGLVRTSEDFGSQGELPSHPKLLDWLAVEFAESGWDVKAMMRLLVTSATYCQDSSSTPALRKLDPCNRLLARGPRLRLQAELVRDNALAVSGLLVDRIGGPSVRPYQPPGLWEEMSHFGQTPATEQKYITDTGDKLYRRSLYTIWKRTVPPPPMIAFDAPNRELCTVRRDRTNTPLQALVLMNETGFVEAARALAQRIMTEGGKTTSERLSFGFMLVTARQPDDDERRILLKTFERECSLYKDDPTAALALLSVGESDRDETLDPAEHAAWTFVANLLLNLSETITKG